jgi:hypothetical protein
MVTEDAVLGSAAGAAAGRDPMKFRNGDISLDEAVEDLVEGVKNGEVFTSPNVDLLVYAVMNTPW